MQLIKQTGEAGQVVLPSQQVLNQVVIERTEQQQPTKPKKLGKLKYLGYVALIIIFMPILFGLMGKFFGQENINKLNGIIRNWWWTGTAIRLALIAIFSWIIIPIILRRQARKLQSDLDYINNNYQQEELNEQAITTMYNKIDLLYTLAKTKWQICALLIAIDLLVTQLPYYLNYISGRW